MIEIAKIEVKTKVEFHLFVMNLEAVEAKMIEADGIQMITSMVAFGIIPVHILNRPFHHMYQIHRNVLCRQATMDAIEQCTMQAIQIDGVVIGKLYGQYSMNFFVFGAVYAI